MNDGAQSRLILSEWNHLWRYPSAWIARVRSSSDVHEVGIAVLGELGCEVGLSQALERLLTAGEVEAASELAFQVLQEGGISSSSSSDSSSREPVDPEPSVPSASDSLSWDGIEARIREAEEAQEREVEREVGYRRARAERAHVTIGEADFEAVRSVYVRSRAQGVAQLQELDRRIRDGAQVEVGRIRHDADGSDIPSDLRRVLDRALDALDLDYAELLVRGGSAPPGDVEIAPSPTAAWVGPTSLADAIADLEAHLPALTAAMKPLPSNSTQDWSPSNPGALAKSIAELLGFVTAETELREDVTVFYLDGRRPPGVPAFGEAVLRRGVPLWFPTQPGTRLPPSLSSMGPTLAFHPMPAMVQRDCVIRLDAAGLAGIARRAEHGMSQFLLQTGFDIPLRYVVGQSWTRPDPSVLLDIPSPLHFTPACRAPSLATLYWGPRGTGRTIRVLAHVEKLIRRGFLLLPWPYDATVAMPLSDSVLMIDDLDALPDGQIDALLAFIARAAAHAPQCHVIVSGTEAPTAYFETLADAVESIALRPLSYPEMHVLRERTLSSCWVEFDSDESFDRWVYYSSFLPKIAIRLAKAIVESLERPTGSEQVIVTADHVDRAWRRPDVQRDLSDWVLSSLNRQHLREAFQLLPYAESGGVLRTEDIHEVWTDLSTGTAMAVAKTRSRTLRELVSAGVLSTHDGHYRMPTGGLGEIARRVASGGEQ